jgi:hypothetical protein
MKQLVLALALLSFAVPAQATVWWKNRPPPLVYTAQMQMPVTINLMDNKTGEKVGTATTMPGSGVLYVRDNKGRFLATVVRRDGKVEFYDESGKPLDRIPGDIAVPAE